MPTLCPTTVAWVESHVGENVVDASPLAGGWTSTMLALRGAAGGEWVLRLLTKEPWRTHGVGLVARERAVHRLLAGSIVPAPTSVAADPAGERTGHPTHLMTRLPGRVVLDRSDGETLGVLAAALVSIHKFTPSARPRLFESWAPPAKHVVPRWSRRPGLWRAAFDLLRGTAPAYDGVFIHRDFHLGNVLWSDGQVSGIVDWVETSWGPAWLDVAHCRTNLAMLHGIEAAECFADSYVTGSASSLDPDRRYWDVMDIVGFLPDPAKVVQPWRDNGVDITDGTAHERLERHLCEVLSR